MLKKIHIGIIGCGAIGSSLAKAITKNFHKQTVLAALFDIDNNKSVALSKKINKTGKIAKKTLNQLIAKSDLIIEASSALNSSKITKQVLLKGRDIVIMSVGGVINSFHELSSIAARKNAKIYIPSGAIAGVDAIKAARINKIRKITLTTRKNPRSFSKVKYVQSLGINLQKIKGEKVLFCVPATEAVKHFPQNINVAAVLSLAGIGSKRTQVKIIASSKVKNNIHEIQVESDAGKITARTENVLHPDNPKTSFLAVLSAIATLKQILGPVRIGT